MQNFVDQINSKDRGLLLGLSLAFGQIFLSVIIIYLLAMRIGFGSTAFDNLREFLRDTDTESSPRPVVKNVTPNKFEEISKLSESQYASAQYDDMLNSGNELEKIATTDQQRGYAFFVQGYAQYAKKNYTESESLINQSLALSPENPTAYAILSAIENTKNNFDKMKTYAQKCIAIAADMGWCHNNLGIVYINTGYRDLAIQEFSEAVRLSPNIAHFSTNLNNAKQSR